MDLHKRILLVEDDTPIAERLQAHLADAGFEVEHVADGDHALRRLADTSWDAMLLDPMLPGVDGLEVCRRARQSGGYLPIVMMSARAAEVHRIQGLELGADDYIAKPFSVLEVVARVRALLRRVDALAREAEAHAVHIEFDGLRLDPLARTASLDGRRIDLAPREFELLLCFARHPGRVLSRGALLEQVWGPGHDGYEHTVNTHIHRLRHKLERHPAAPERIRTVWGRGYRLERTRAAQAPAR